MEYKPKRPVWTDIRANIRNYSSQEMLDYYRSAKLYCSDMYPAEKNIETKAICIELYTFVDIVIAAMRCDTDFRTAQIAKLLSLEYCEEQSDITEKLRICQISRTSYYTYLKDGRQLFEKLAAMVS